MISTARAERVGAGSTWRQRAAARGRAELGGLAAHAQLFNAFVGMGTLVAVNMLRAPPLQEIGGATFAREPDGYQKIIQVKVTDEFSDGGVTVVAMNGKYKGMEGTVSEDDFFQPRHR